MAGTRTNLAVSVDFPNSSSGRSTSPHLAATRYDEAQAEREFTEAMRLYKLSSGRMFPTWSEVLEVLQGLGYHKPATDAEAGR